MDFELAIANDADGFLARLTDREARGGPVTLRYAKEAMRQMLARAHAEGLAFVLVTTDPDNVASRRVIEANGGVLVERFTRGPQYGSTPALRYRIDLEK